MAINNTVENINNQPTIEPRTVTGIFTKYIAKTLPLAFDESMSYYECLCALLEYLNETIVPDINNVNDGLSELQTFYLELQDYVNTYFDSLDVQEEINNKLDKMAQDGVLDQIIEQYLNSSAIWGFDNVAAMKEATNLIDGSYARTLGYYTKNDGGSALYKIRNITNDDIIDNATIIPLNDSTNQLIAELITNKIINVKQFGAYGDNTHDDTQAIQKALLLLNDYKVIIPKGTYLISNSLELIDKDYRQINLSASDSVINYTGNDYAFVLKSITFAELNFGTIISTNGGCIKFYSNQLSNSSSYVHLNFVDLQSSTNCIYATRTEGWINEFIVNGGKLSSGEWGVNLEIDSETGSYGGWKFYNICVEGVNNGFKFNAINGSISDVSIINPRYAEISTYTYLIQTIGRCNRIRFVGNSIFYFYKSRFTSDTTYAIIDSPIVYKDYPVFYNGGIISNGTLIPNENNYPQLNNYFDRIEDNDDLNNFLYPGTYNSYNVSDANSVSNMPIGGYTYLGFRLIVTNVSQNIATYDSHKSVNQILITGTNRIFMRNIHWSSGHYVYGTWVEINNSGIGATGSRPSNISAGYQYFDTTLGKPIWYNGTNWVGATGTQV